MLNLSLNSKIVSGQLSKALILMSNLKLLIAVEIFFTSIYCEDFKNIEVTYTINAKFTVKQAMKVQKGSRCIAILFL